MADLRGQQIKDRFQSLLTTSETTSDPTTGTLQNGNGANITALTLGGTLSATKLVPTGNVTAGNGMYLPTTNTLAFSTNGAERVRVNASGNVGIGTTNPDYGSFGATERILGITGVTGNRGRLSLQNTSTETSGAAGTIAFFNGTTSLASLDVIADGATNSGRFSFNTNNAGTVSERMRINSAGNVGIGTNAPTVPLHVTGAGDVARLQTTTAGGLVLSRVNNVGINSLHYSLKFNNSDSTIASISTINATGAVTSSGTGYELRLDTAGAGMSTFFTNGSERMRITSAGVVELSQGQIKFPATQVASADPNTLDDYEEGTFTPTYVPETGTFTTLTYSLQFGKYTKIGNTVHFTIALATSNVSVGTASGFVIITALPFAANFASSAFGGASIGVMLRFATDMPNAKAGINDALTELFIAKNATNAGALSFLSVTDLLTGASGFRNYINISGTYHTS